tara:strand:- start:290 stop:481 length:192 start_codon:yes stop_codon:yes gene_type:complete
MANDNKHIGIISRWIELNRKLPVKPYPDYDKIPKHTEGWSVYPHKLPVAPYPYPRKSGVKDND